MVSVAMLAALAAAPARAQTPGISESEIKVGATFTISDDLLRQYVGTRVIFQRICV